MSLESEEEMEYLTMPEQLRDKFIPLDFVPLCTKEQAEHDWLDFTKFCFRTNFI